MTMNDYLERHPWVYYTLVIGSILSINLFERWRRGDEWSDILLFSALSTLMLGGGLIGAFRWRRKKDQKNRRFKEEMEKRLKDEYIHPETDD